MQNLIEKKKMYEKHISGILNAIKIDVAVFKQKKMEELELQCQIREKDLMKAAEREIQVYETRIKVLSDIICEDMPEATTINNLIAEEKCEVVEELPEEIVEEIEEEIVEEVIEEELCEEPINSEDSVLEIAEEEIIDLDIIDEIPNEAEIFDEVVINKKEEVVLDRPGMTQITIPSRG